MTQTSVTSYLATAMHPYLLRSADAAEEDEVGEEEAERQVEVDGGARALDGATEAKGQDADEQTHQRHGQTDPRDQLQLKGVLGRRGKQTTKDKKRNVGQKKIKKNGNFERQK